MSLEEERITELQAEVSELQAEVRHWKGLLKAETKLRPRWAQGYSSDSEAAQSSQIALHQIYEKLGVSDQTQAMLALKGMNRNG